jgi:hypothetical protein
MVVLARWRRRKATTLCSPAPKTFLSRLASGLKTGKQQAINRWVSGDEQGRIRRAHGGAGDSCFIANVTGARAARCPRLGSAQELEAAGRAAVSCPGLKVSLLGAARHGEVGMEDRAGQLAQVRLGPRLAARPARPGLPDSVAALKKSGGRRGPNRGVCASRTPPGVGREPARSSRKERMHARAVPRQIQETDHVR